MSANSKTVIQQKAAALIQLGGLVGMLAVGLGGSVLYIPLKLGGREVLGLTLCLTTFLAYFFALKNVSKRGDHVADDFVEAVFWQWVLYAFLLVILATVAGVIMYFVM